MVDLYNGFRLAKIEHWIDALSWFLFNGIGSLMPIWGLWIILGLFSKTLDWGSISEHGEFALYSAATISGALYVITKDYSPNLINVLLRGDFSRAHLRASFPGGRIFQFILMTLLVISSLIFTGATVAHLPQVNLQLNMDWLTNLSIGIFILTSILSYLATVLDNAFSHESEVDFTIKLNEQGNDLKAQVTAKRKGI